MYGYITFVPEARVLHATYIGANYEKWLCGMYLKQGVLLAEQRIYRWIRKDFEDLDSSELIV